MDEKIIALQKMIDESRKIVFFGGAGVSTESGIKDFRSVDGLYSQKYDVDPETMLSHSSRKINPIFTNCMIGHMINPIEPTNYKDS